MIAGTAHPLGAGVGLAAPSRIFPVLRSDSGQVRVEGSTALGTSVTRQAPQQIATLAAPVEPGRSLRATFLAICTERDPPIHGHQSSGTSPLYERVSKINEVRMRCVSSIILDARIHEPAHEQQQERAVGPKPKTRTRPGLAGWFLVFLSRCTCLQQEAPRQEQDYAGDLSGSSSPAQPVRLSQV